MSKIIKLNAGEILINEGEELTELYLVQSGELDVIRHRQGYEIHLDRIKEGELIGEMAMIDKKSRSATIRALKDCEIILFSTDEIYHVFNTQPKIIQVLLQTLVDRLRKTNARVKS